MKIKNRQNVVEQTFEQPAFLGGFKIYLNGHHFV
jgi:hypothetical protein